MAARRAGVTRAGALLYCNNFWKGRARARLVGDGDGGGGEHRGGVLDHLVVDLPYILHITHLHYTLCIYIICMTYMTSHSCHIAHNIFYTWASSEVGGLEHLAARAAPFAAATHPAPPPSRTAAKRDHLAVDLFIYMIYPPVHIHYISPSLYALYIRLVAPRPRR